MIKVSPPRNKSLVSIFAATIVATGFTIESDVSLEVDGALPPVGALVARIV
jgi:hypothetical protein